MHRFTDCSRFGPGVFRTVVLLLGVLASGPLFGQTRPNIVVLLCDDLGYGDLECYGHPHIKTPHLNALAEGGIRFTDFYSAAPVCSPSRVGLLTGRSPNRAGVYDWIPPAGDKPRADAREQVHLRKGEFTLARLLGQAGYATCLAGKWHCNSKFNHGDQPQPDAFGFDHWLATQNNAAPSHADPTNFVRNGAPVGKLAGYSCQLVVDEAINWLDQRGNVLEDEPFFLFVPFHEPHEPVASPPELVARYQDVAETEDEAQYFANVTNVDLAVGRLMRALDERGLRDDTLVIFTSDNGPETLRRYRGANRSWGKPGPLKGMKLHTHEAGFRVVGIMHWPARIASGQVVDTPVSSLDFLPSFAELAGVAPPGGLELDGTSFLPALRGEDVPRSKPLVWLYFNALNDARVAMRHGHYKVLARLDGGKFPRLTNVTADRVAAIEQVPLTDFEIYDLRKDLGEEENLVNSDLAEIGQLQATLVRSFRELVAGSHAWVPTLEK